LQIVANRFGVDPATQRLVMACGSGQHDRL
jgi:hypothetical protein